MRARNKRTASEKRHVLILKLRKILRGGGGVREPPPSLYVRGLRGTFPLWHWLPVFAYFSLLALSLLNRHTIRSSITVFTIAALGKIMVESFP